jgi:hypothetical protein
VTVTDTITSARVEVTFGSGRSYVIELESVEGMPIVGQLNVETEAVEDGPASWEAGYVIKRPGMRTADITLKGKVR